jgi:hypothetical protein
VAEERKGTPIGIPEEYEDAACGYIAYCGIYRVDEENRTMTHIPSVALLPNLLTGRLIRSLTLSTDRLTIRTAIASLLTARLQAIAWNGEE